MNETVRNHIRIALEEDLKAEKDVTSRAIFTDEVSTYYLVSKDDGILCGLDIFREIYTQVDPSIEIFSNKKDGDRISYGEEIAVLKGNTATLLEGERTALNYLGHLSGIATKAQIYAEEAQGKTQILDTRKTIPGLRELEKYAVACGGAMNHRMGLYDMVMIKDNHIDAAGSIKEAVNRIRAKWKNRFKIEVETRNLEEVRQALEMKVDRIMLDNMSNEMMKKAVKIIGDKAETEASGNMTLGRIKEVSQTGVDFISVGDLTHTVTVFDFSIRKNL